jgi:hypothetical protein
MSNILNYLFSFVLVIAFIGCQSDTSDNSQKQSPQQQTQQQPDQLGQMQQQSAPDIDVSDSEVQTFVKAVMNAQKVQMKAQKKMIGIIQDEGLDVETYQKMAQSGEPGQTPQGEEFTEDQMAKYESATTALQEAQGEIQKEVTAAIEETGMEMQRFQQISQAAQQDPELQKRVQTRIQEETGGMQGMQQQQAPTNN